MIEITMARLVVPVNSIFNVNGKRYSCNCDTVCYVNFEENNFKEISSLSLDNCNLFVDTGNEYIGIEDSKLIDTILHQIKQQIQDSLNRELETSTISIGGHKDVIQMGKSNTQEE